MGKKYDEIDKRIVFRLVQNARDISAPEIAKEEGVSPATIRNRIKKLENDGVIKGYHADIAYEKLDSKLTALFKCSSKVQDRSELARKALQVRGIVHVREIITGSEDIHAKAIGADTEDINRIARELVELGLTISDEDLIQQEYVQPYHEFGPKGDEVRSLLDFRTILGPAEVATVKVIEGSPVVNKSVEEVSNSGHIKEDALLLSIERGDKTIVPKGNTTIKTGDIISIFSATGIGEETLKIFNS